MSHDHNTVTSVQENAARSIAGNRQLDVVRYTDGCWRYVQHAEVES